MTSQAQNDTRLRSRRLIYARLTWTVITLFYLGSFVAALPDTLSQREGFAQQSQGWTEAEMRISLAQLGISFESYQNYDTWSNLTITLIFFGLGLFIFWRRSDDWMALLFSILFITFPGTTIFGSLAQHHLAWKTVQALTNSLSSMNFIVLFIFPDGRFVPRWTRWVALGFAGVQIWRLIQPDLYQQLQFVYTLPTFVCLLLSQIYRYRRVSTPTQRQQTKWVVYGLAVGFTPLLVYLLFFLSNPDFNEPGALGMAIFLLGNLLWTFTLVSLVFSVALAILRSRLWDIDLIIRRTLVYSVLTITLGLVYFGLVILLEGALRSLVGGSGQIATVISTLAIFILFAPLRRRVQDFIDRRFYRRKYNAEHALAEFAATARAQTDLEALTAQVVSIVQQTMQPEQVSFWLRKPKSE